MGRGKIHNNGKWWFGASKAHLIPLLLALLLTQGVAWWVESRALDHTKSAIGGTLSAILDTNHRAINLWVRGHLHEVGYLASTPLIRRHAIKLLAVPRNPDALLAEQEDIRNELSWLYRVGGYKGFFIIAPDNLSLASSRDANVGTTNLLTSQPDLLRRLWAGESAVSRLMASDVPLAGVDGRGGENTLTMFAGSPIRDESGNIIALLTLRLDPVSEYFELLKEARFGNTGSTYMFDHDGRLLSESVFITQLYDIGLLMPGQREVLNLQIKDPGVDLTKGERDQTPRLQQPFTHMVTSALNEGRGMDLEGYRDYRGVTVIGAWLWDKKLNVGLAVEQDAAEAFSPLYTIRMIIYAFALFVSLLLIGLTLISAWGRRALQISTTRLQALVDTILDAVVVIDEKGIIESANPAVEKIFGYDRKQLVGQNVKCLMPAPYYDEHDDYLKRYLNTGEAHIMGMGREVIGQHRSGHQFAIELGVSEMWLADKRYFTGIIRDISARKAIENNLERERQFNELTLDAVPAEIVVMDEFGKIIYVNDSWRRPNDEAGDLVGNMVGRDFVAFIETVAGFRRKGATLIARHLNAMMRRDYDGFSETVSCVIDGIEYWYMVRAACFSQDAHQRVVLTRIDITERREVEIALLKEKETAQRYLDVASIMLLVVNADETVSLINRWGCYLLGLPEKRIMGRNWFDEFVLVQDRTKGRMAFQSLMSGKTEFLDSHTDSIISESGEERLMSWRGQPLRDSDGNIGGALFSGEDITERIQAEHALKNSEERMRSLLMSTGEAIYGLDTDGCCIFANAACVEILGYSDSGQLLGRNMHDLIHHTHVDHTPYPKDDCPIGKALMQGAGAHVVDEYFWRSSGERFPVEYRSEPIKRDGKITGVVVSFSDITERKHMIQELHDAKEAALEASRTKSAFLATMSHEIRTPMNGVVGMIDVLCRTSLDEGQQEMIQSARESAYSLLRIIDDVLDFSKIEAGRLELEQVDVSLEQSVEIVAENLLPMAQQKNIELIIYCSPWLPLVTGDPVRIRQVLFNLVGNAVKFTGTEPEKKGRIFIGADLLGRKGDCVKVVLWVKDNGIGMSSEVLAELFQPFVQGESSTTRRFGGTGLGLTICQRLITMMGGQVEVESKVGEGSEFKVFLTLGLAADEISSESIDLSGINAIILSRNYVIYSAWESYVAQAGANVAVAETIEKLVELGRKMLDQHDDNVIIIDTECERTDMGDALHVRKRLNLELGEIGLRYLMLGRGRRRAARQIEDDSLELDCIAMKRSSFLRAIAAACSRISVPDKGPPLVDESVRQPLLISHDEAEATGALILIAEDNKTNQKVLTTQLEMLGYIADVAGDGEEALKCWRTWRYALVLTDCHMPQMDGYDLARTIRKEEGEENHTPIVAITADALKGTQQRCLAAGMDDYVTKPVQLDVLEQKLKNWIAIRSDRGNSMCTTNDVDNIKQQQIVDPDALKGTLGVDDKSVLAGFYDDFLHSGEETLDEIKQAFLVGKGVEVGRLAHRLKSSARTIGANVLADCCLALEIAGKDGDWPRIELNMTNLSASFSSVRDWISQWAPTEKLS